MIRTFHVCTASLLMLATGTAVAWVTDFWPLIVVAVIGIINPSGGDVSLFLPTEQALLSRAALSSMDVPARASCVMAVVTPAERAAAGITHVPRSIASALSPALAGYMLTLSSFGWPLVFCGALKIAYDLTLLKMFRAVKPPEEKREKA